MFTLLDSLRGKPEPVRRRIAIAATGVIGGIIGLFWVSASLLDIDDGSAPAIAETSSPLQIVGKGGTSFTENVANGFAYVQAQFRK